MDTVKAMNQANKNFKIYTKVTEEYRKQAEAVGLSKEWQNKIENGTYDISTLTDKDLIQKIQDYQELYDNMPDCVEKANEYKATI